MGRRQCRPPLPFRRGCRDIDLRVATSRVLVRRVRGGLSCEESLKSHQVWTSRPRSLLLEIWSSSARGAGSLLTRVREGSTARVDPRELLIANIDVVDRVVAFVCREDRLDTAEAEDFVATVKLKLIEGDYAIVRRFEGRSSFATFLGVVVHRMLLDYRNHLWGKWHASAEAKRFGPAGIELEKLFTRDGRSLDDACERVIRRFPETDRSGLYALASRLPERKPRVQIVDLDAAADVSASVPTPPSAERLARSGRVSAVVTEFVETLPPDDRLILQLRFDADMRVADIARSLHLPEKPLYRRIERHLRELRDRLESEGIAAAEAEELIGDRSLVLDFKLGKSAAHPSTADEKRITPGQEEVTR
jgi:RNA polymerase sigma factor (sigma-70 family)